MTNKQQLSRINDVLHKIHGDISAPLSAVTLAKTASYSEQHFHRVFHKVVGETVNHYIRRTRLEHAANQLMFDANSSVIDIAEKCGFNSSSSFSKVFNEAFGCTPGKWRALDHSHDKKHYLSDPEIAAGYSRVESKMVPAPELVTLNDQPVAYVRHQGYGRSIRLAWQTLQAWAASEDRPFDRQLGLHHSNPAWVALPQCRYVACLGIDKPLLRRGVVSSMSIPGGLHAAFKLEGRYGELLPWLSKILEHWLPRSGLKMKTTPAFVRYDRNHFLEENEEFQLVFYLPVSLL